VSADVLRPAEFRARLGISRTRFWELESEGRFKRLQNLTVSARSARACMTGSAWMRSSPIDLKSSRSGRPDNP
jgi:hypothetical protein